MKIKRIIAAVTALMFIGETYAFVSSETSKSITAFAAETVEATSVTEKGVSYNVYGDYATVAEVNGELGCEIVISDDIGGKPVKSAAYGYAYLLLLSSMPLKPSPYNSGISSSLDTASPSI